MNTEIGETYIKEALSPYCVIVLNRQNCTQFHSHSHLSFTVIAISLKQQKKRKFCDSAV